MKIFVNKIKYSIFTALLFSLVFLPVVSIANEVNLITTNDESSVDIFMSPQNGSFLGGSSFEVPFFINTKGKSVTNIDLDISYDSTRLGITRPSNGKSIIGVWKNAPGFDNNKGTANFSGAIQGGIVSESGLITSITFEAKSEGQAWISITDKSKATIFDGKDIQAKINTNRGTYTIFPKPQGNVVVYSDTHPLEDKWSNNINAVFSWNKTPNVIGYSYVLDNKPNTLPENRITSNDTIKQYENLSDGIWYFHIKSLKQGDIWGTTTNRILKIDTTPPKNFKPKVQYIHHGNSNIASISFNTTDALSGIDHYEVGITDTSKNSTQDTSPVFNYAESPYQVSLDSINSAQVIIRAIDRAGNIIDSSINVQKSSIVWQFLYNNKFSVLVIIILILIALYVLHYFRDHRIFKRLRMLDNLIKVEDQKLKDEELKEEKAEEKLIESIKQPDQIK